MRSKPSIPIRYRTSSSNGEVYHLSLASYKESSSENFPAVFIAGDDQSAPAAIKTARIASSGEEIPVAQKGPIGPAMRRLCK